MKAVVVGMEQRSWVLTSPHAGAHFLTHGPEAREPHARISSSQHHLMPLPTPPPANSDWKLREGAGRSAFLALLLPLMNPLGRIKYTCEGITFCLILGGNDRGYF